MRVSLCDCENVLLREIADKKMKRNDIAKTYYLSLISDEMVSYKKVNQAIVKRWSYSGLKYIKNLAWSGKAFLTP